MPRQSKRAAPAPALQEDPFPADALGRAAERVRQVLGDDATVTVVPSGAAERRTPDEARSGAVFAWLANDPHAVALRPVAGEQGVPDYGMLRDPRTGLPNRELLLDRLTLAAERARRHPEFRFAVLSLSLDQFKIVSDSLGHEAADALLAELAMRIHACVRAEDTVTLWSGDEFVVLLESLADDSDGVRVTERIQRRLAQPIAIGDREVFASASVGIVLSSSGPETPSRLVQQAGIAMSRARATGPGRFAMFDLAMHARVLARLHMETDLRRAVERQEFEIYYQPLVTLADGRISEVEALVRWNHPQRGLVPPLEFIPLAEEIGLIPVIGSWVLDQACRQVAEWQRRFPRGRDAMPLSLSVNLSVKQMGTPDFVGQVAGIVKASGLDPRSLKLEITETFALEEPERTRGMLEELRALGIRIYLDDFGTGYSSLNYLHRLPLDAIKIDRSFVMRMDAGPTHLQLVRTVRELARNIGVAAVAEGVESAAQLEMVRELGCESAQGYLFSRPVPAQEAERFLAADPRW